MRMADCKMGSLGDGVTKSLVGERYHYMLSKALLSLTLYPRFFIILKKTSNLEDYLFWDGYLSFQK